MELDGVNAVVGIVGVSDVGVTFYRVNLLRFQYRRLYLVLLIMVLVLVVRLLRLLLCTEAYSVFNREVHVLAAP
jgi:hypothetical protein